MLAIKDMAGLCKPAAAATLIKTLKQEIGIPIHFHTHDTAGIQAASILMGSDVGLDVADAALAAEAHIGIMLPCNVIVQTAGEGKTEVAAVDPLVAMSRVENPALEPVAKEVQAKLQRVIANL